MEINLDCCLLPDLAGAVHVHFVHLDELEVNHRWLGVLSDEERVRMKRLVNPVHAQRFAWSRIVLRHLIATYLDTQPESVVFERRLRGKPVLSGQYAGSGLQFSLSHSQNCIALAFSRHHLVGVDLEWAKEKIDALSIAKRFFSTKEFFYLDSITDELTRLKHFYHLWVGKEAWLKATGRGITNGLNQVQVLLGKVPLIELQGDLCLQYPGGYGWLNYLTPPDGYVAAVVRSGSRVSPVEFCSYSAQWSKVL